MPQAPMNKFALVSFIGSFFIGLIGVIFGHISLSQIKKTGERGQGFALAGLIIGYTHTIIMIVVSISAIMMMVASLTVLSTVTTDQDEWNATTDEQHEEIDDWSDETSDHGADEDDEANPWADLEQRLEERDRFFAEQQLPTDGSLPKAVTPEQKRFLSDVQERGFAIEASLADRFEAVVISIASDACETAILNGGDMTEMNARAFSQTSPIVLAMTEDSSDANRVMITSELMQIVRMGTPYMCPNYAPQWIDSIDAIDGNW